MAVTVSFTPGGDGFDPWARRPRAPEPPPPPADPAEDDGPEMSEAARIFDAWLDRTQQP